VARQRTTWLIVKDMVLALPPNLRDPSTLCCGVDEAGRGPLAGAVYAAAVILNPAKPIMGLADSKVLSEKRRARLEDLIMRDALAYSVAFSTIAEIDAINILQASLLAMKRAVEGLTCLPGQVLVDGLHVPKISIPATAIVDGDQHIAEISAASILAKNARDREMIALCKQYPQYGFSRHKGYGTREHLAALKLYGPCAIHRQSFAPVRLAGAQQMLWKVSTR
jgi:ribonuclease HII